MDLALDVVIFEGLRVDVWQVLQHLLLVIVGLTQVASLAWNHEGNLLGAHASRDQTLDSAVRVKRASVDHAVLRTAAVCERIH